MRDNFWIHQKRNPVVIQTFLNKMCRKCSFAEYLETSNVTKIKREGKTIQVNNKQLTQHQLGVCLI